MINSPAAVESPPVLSECIQLTGQIELADCNQTIWPYGMRAIPSGLLSGKYVGIELELIAHIDSSCFRACQNIFWQKIIEMTSI